MVGYSVATKELGQPIYLTIGQTNPDYVSHTQTKVHVCLAKRRARVVFFIIQF